MSSRQASVIEGHRVSTRLLDETFAGPVSASTMAELQAGQLSRRLLLLKAVRGLAASEDAWRTLVAADEAAPDAVRQVLTYPAVGTWLVRAVRKARGIIADDGWGTEIDYLGSVAAAAAISAGLPVSIDVPVWHGRVHLPTIGQFAATGESARVRHPGPGGQVEIDGAPAMPVPLRHHHSRAAGVEVLWAIDDIDPYRAFSVVEPPDRLDDAEFGHWCGLLDHAWRILVEHHADYAAELALVNPVIVPVPSRLGLVASSSSSSFGAIIVATPDSPAALAETLVHELQHSKLNAVLDLVRLEADTPRLCYAPWRTDPRPLPGLLHGIYAFMSVAEFWWRQRHAEPGSRRADFKFLYHREQVRGAVRAVAAMPELTEFGTRLVDAVRTRLDACDSDVVPGETAETVALLLATHRFSWRLRHLAPPVEHVEELATRWLAAGAPPGRHDATLVPDNRPEAESSLYVLLKKKALGRSAATGGEHGEQALADGRNEDAVRDFTARIGADPDDDAAWVGLFAATGVTDERVPIETVSATYRRLSAGGHDGPDPVALAGWFANRNGSG
jgi:HEXXH motif-containing protein